MRYSKKFFHITPQFLFFKIKLRFSLHFCENTFLRELLAFIAGKFRGLTEKKFKKIRQQIVNLYLIFSVSLLLKGG